MHNKDFHEFLSLGRDYSLVLAEIVNCRMLATRYLVLVKHESSMCLNLGFDGLVIHHLATEWAFSLSLA